MTQLEIAPIPAAAFILSRNSVNQTQNEIFEI
jgi:hypothetical protein